MAKLNEPTHMTHGSVLDDLGSSPKKAAVLKMRAEARAAQEGKEVHTKGASGDYQRVAARGSEFLNGRIAPVSFEKMIVYAFRLGTKTKNGTRLAGRTFKGKAPVAAKTKRRASLNAGRDFSNHCQSW